MSRRQTLPLEGTPLRLPSAGGGRRGVHRKRQKTTDLPVKESALQWTEERSQRQCEAPLCGLPNELQGTKTGLSRLCHAESADKTWGRRQSTGPQKPVPRGASRPLPRHALRKAARCLSTRTPSLRLVHIMAPRALRRTNCPWRVAGVSGDPGRHRPSRWSAEGPVVPAGSPPLSDVQISGG